MKIQKFRQSFTDYVNILISKSSQNQLNLYAERRGYKIETVKKLNIFYIGKQAELLIPDYLGNLEDFGVISNVNKKPIYHDRYIIPLYDINGLVMALCGYSFDADEKYIYSTTKYFSRADSLYGIECMKDILKSDDVIVVEGLTDRIRLIDLGFNNVLSTTGARKSLYRMKIIDTINNVIFIHDRDKAGLLAINYWETHNFVRLYIPIIYKDIDLYGLEEKYKDFIVETIETIFNGMHCGKYGRGQELSMR